MPERQTLMNGLVVGESPRWHAGRLWFSNWGAQEIIAVDVNGRSEVMVRVPTTVPFSIDWLPDGRLLVVSGPEARLLRQEPDRSLATHADLSGLAKGWNEIVVDGRGNTYVNGGDYKFGPGEPFVPGVVALVTPDGSVRQVADDIHFPNGMVVTPDNKTLVVCSRLNNYLYSYSLPDLKPLGAAELGGKGAAWVTLTPDGKTAYVANPVTNDVSVIDVKTMKEVTRIPVGYVPKRNTTGVLQ